MEAQIPQVIFPGIEAELSNYCPNCGTEVHLPEMPQAETESFGVAKTIESILRYDLDITLEYGRSQFETLFRLADHYDRLLKAEFGCLDRLTEK